MILPYAFIIGRVKDFAHRPSRSQRGNVLTDTSRCPHASTFTDTYINMQFTLLVYFQEICIYY